MPDKPPWFEQMQDHLDYLRATDEKTFLQWNWYCREMLNLDPNVVPITYLENWLKLPPSRREMGY